VRILVIALSANQIEILLETIDAFVDNQKLIHLYDKSGAMVGLPLTKQALQKILSLMQGEKTDIEVTVDDQQPTEAKVKVSLLDQSFEYQVNLEEFDEQ
jgi:hypothetical protein